MDSQRISLMGLSLSLILNDTLTIDLFEIQSKSEWFDECKTGPRARSWDDKSVGEAVLIKGRPQAPVGPTELDYICSCSQENIVQQEQVISWLKQQAPSNRSTGSCPICKSLEAQ